MRWCGPPPPMATVWTLGGRSGMPKNDTERAGGQREGWRPVLVDGPDWQWVVPSRGVPRKPTAGRPSGRLGGHAGIRSMSGPVAAAPSLRCAPAREPPAPAASGASRSAGDCRAGSDGPHAMERLTRANRPPERPKRPRSGKSAHEDRRHGVFSGEVVSRYPRRGTPGSWAGRSTARRRRRTVCACGARRRRSAPER